MNMNSPIMKIQLPRSIYFRNYHMPLAGGRCCPELSRGLMWVLGCMAGWIVAVNPLASGLCSVARYVCGQGVGEEAWVPSPKSLRELQSCEPLPCGACGVRQPYLLTPSPHSLAVYVDLRFPHLSKEDSRFWPCGVVAWNLCDNDQNMKQLWWAAEVQR